MAFKLGLEGRGHFFNKETISNSPALGAAEQSELGSLAWEDARGGDHWVHTGT